MLAGLDGIKNKIEPAEPIDKDIYELPPDEMAEIEQVPTSLDAVLEALEADHDYLTRGRRLHARPDRDVDRLQAANEIAPMPCARTRTSSSSTTTSDDPCQ
jgi:glutamine synthetase